MFFFEAFALVLSVMLLPMMHVLEYLQGTRCGCSRKLVFSRKHCGRDLVAAEKPMAQSQGGTRTFLQRVDYAQNFACRVCKKEWCEVQSEYRSSARLETFQPMQKSNLILLKRKRMHRRKRTEQL